MREVKYLSLLDAITEVSQEREIDREELILALENSILQAAQRKYTNFDNIEVSLDRKSGEVSIVQYKVVVKDLEDSENELTLDEAKYVDAEAEIGDQIAYPISTKEFSKTIAQATRFILFGKVRDIERELITKKFANKIMEIVHGKVARVEANRVYVILGNNIEGILDRREMLWNDNFQSGDMIRSLLLSIKPEGRNHVLVLSRTHPDFLAKLLKIEIPEIFDGSIKIVNVAREAGNKSKIVVRSEDPDIDPVGACIGPRGSRISPIISELNGERIDILTWKENPAERINEALNVEGISQITIDTDRQIAYVEIQEDNLPAAIGKRGQNVRLAQKITDYQIKFVAISEEKKRKELLSGLFKDGQSNLDAQQKEAAIDNEEQAVSDAQQKEAAIDNEEQTVSDAQQKEAAIDDEEQTVPDAQQKEAAIDNEEQTVPDAQQKETAIKTEEQTVTTEDGNKTFMAESAELKKELEKIKSDQNNE